jgi:hypothetical protein
MKSWTVLSREEVDEIVKDLQLLIIEYPNVFRRIEGFAKMRAHEKIAYIIKRQGNSVYEFLTRQKISLKNLEGIHSVITKIRSLEPDSKTSTLIKKITGTCEELQKRIALSGSGNKKKRETRFNIIQQFSNSQWYLYERFERTLGRRVINFGNMKKAGLINVSIKQVSTQFSELDGTAFCDSTGNFLILQTLNQKRNSANTNFMLRLDPDCPEMKIIIGHMTFQHRDRNNVVTKSIVLERQQPDASLTSRYMNFGDPEMASKTEIVKFLYSRKQNRLSSPHDRVITDMENFSEWHAKNMNLQKAFSVPGPLLGDYILFYNVHPSREMEIVKGYLKLSRNKYSQEVTAIYMDDMFTDLDNMDEVISENLNSPNNYWKSKPYVNDKTRVMTAHFHGPFSRDMNDKREYISDDKRMFLMLKLTNSDKADTFTGLISGMRHEDKGVVGRLVVAIKRKTVEAKRDKVNKTLEDFFSAFAERSWIRPNTKKTVTKFDDLNQELFKEGLETRMQFRSFYKPSPQQP